VLLLGLVGINRVRGGPVDIGTAAGQLLRVDDAERVEVGPKLATQRRALRGGCHVTARCSYGITICLGQMPLLLVD
jgi:hypothetical protein